MDEVPIHVDPHDVVRRLAIDEGHRELDLVGDAAAETGGDLRLLEVASGEIHEVQGQAVRRSLVFDADVRHPRAVAAIGADRHGQAGLDTARISRREIKLGLEVGGADAAGLATVLGSGLTCFVGERDGEGLIAERAAGDRVRDADALVPSVGKLANDGVVAASVIRWSKLPVRLQPLWPFGDPRLKPSNVTVVSSAWATELPTPAKGAPTTAPPNPSTTAASAETAGCHSHWRPLTASLLTKSHACPSRPARATSCSCDITKRFHAEKRQATGRTNAMSNRASHPKPGARHWCARPGPRYAVVFDPLIRLNASR